MQRNARLNGILLPRIETLRCRLLRTCYSYEQAAADS